MLNSDQIHNDLTSKFMRNIFLHVQAFQAENEWVKIKERQAQGIAVAKATGKKLGRDKKTRTKIELKVAKQYLDNEIDLDTALTMLNLKKSAFYSLCQVVKNV